MLHLAQAMVGEAGLDFPAPTYTERTQCHPTRTLGNMSHAGPAEAGGCMALQEGTRRRPVIFCFLPSSTQARDTGYNRPCLAESCEPRMRGP